MEIEFMYFAGCSSYERALARLRRVLEETGVDAQIQLREVTSDSLASEPNFHGSPTIIVDGRDIDPVGIERQPGGLTCRIYRDGAGRPVALPPEDTIRRALVGES